MIVSDGFNNYESMRVPMTNGCDGCAFYPQEMEAMCSKHTCTGKYDVIYILKEKETPCPREFI